MVGRILKKLAYLGALCAGNLKAYGPEKKKLAIMSLVMFAQDGLFLLLWAVLFNNVGDLKGWRLCDVARMIGIVSSAIGISLFFFDGARSIATRVRDGSMDFFAAKPRWALPMILFSSSSPASLGDICYGPVLWLVLGAISAAQWPLMIFLTLVSAAIFTASMVIIFSLSFWLKGNARFPEQLFLLLVIFSSVIQHGQPLVVQILMYSVVPAGFIAYLPAELMRHFDGQILALILVAALCYVGVAIYIFNKGLARYRDAMT